MPTVIFALPYVVCHHSGQTSVFTLQEPSPRMISSFHSEKPLRATISQDEVVILTESGKIVRQGTEIATIPSPVWIPRVLSLFFRDDTIYLVGSPFPVESTVPVRWIPCPEDSPFVVFSPGTLSVDRFGVGERFVINFDSLSVTIGMSAYIMDKHPVVVPYRRDALIVFREDKQEAIPLPVLNAGLRVVWRDETRYVVQEMGCVRCVWNKIWEHPGRARGVWGNSERIYVAIENLKEQGVFEVRDDGASAVVTFCPDSTRGRVFEHIPRRIVCTTETKGGTPIFLPLWAA